jgi:hypothetical protein
MMHKCKFGGTLATVLVASLSLNNAIAAQNTFNIDMSAQEQPKKDGKHPPKGQQRAPQQRSITRQPSFQPGVVQQPKMQQRSIEQRRIITQQPGPQLRSQPGTVTGPRVLGQPKQFGHVTIRNAGNLNVAGRNYSVWRDSHREYRDGYWRTFVGLGALSAVAFGAAYYYPYAYIDAPAPYCDGLTEDGCQLQWEPVPTIEGPTAFACVAYCPWQ